MDIDKVAHSQAQTEEANGWNDWWSVREVGWLVPEREWKRY